MEHLTPTQLEWLKRIANENYISMMQIPLRTWDALLLRGLIDRKEEYHGFQGLQVILTDAGRATLAALEK